MPPRPLLAPLACLAIAKAACTPAPPPLSATLPPPPSCAAAEAPRITNAEELVSSGDLAGEWVVSFEECAHRLTVKPSVPAEG